MAELSEVKSTAMNTHILLVIVFVGIAAVSSHNIPRLQYHEGQEWMLMPDGEGKIHLVNLKDTGTGNERFDVEQDVFFELYTRNNVQTPIRINTDDVNSLRESTFNSNHMTIIICHGWNNNGNSDVNVDIRTAYLAVGDFNVIVVDWGVGANSLYTLSRGYVREVGPRVGRFIDFLQDAGVDLNRLHLVGHSLGAHIVGLASANARGVPSGVTGLDPAWPLFSTDLAHDRINETSAAYVEIIHTNGGLLGFMDPIGQADFYPNGGSSQPGCGIDIAGVCAHARSHEFYADSIRLHTWPFTSTRCGDFQQILNNNCEHSGPTAEMGGINVNHGESGIFHVVTASSRPFALG